MRLMVVNYVEIAMAMNRGLRKRVCDPVSLHDHAILYTRRAYVDKRVY
jgi:hypothetical protein